MKDAGQEKSTEQQFVQRFGLQFRIQHTFLFVGTLILIFTGIPMWFLARPEYVFWGRDFGGIEYLRFFHRIGAAGLIAVSVYHLFYTVFTREGRREFIQLLPKFKDVLDVMQNSLYFLGLSKKKPRFDRYSYCEKFDYWAVYWGCVIMIGTGLVLWFDRFFAEVIGWFPYELAVEIHADEAILATLALLIWHFYNVHFNPSKFPGSLLWWHGRMSREEMLDEHPLEWEKIMRDQSLPK